LNLIKVSKNQNCLWYNQFPRLRSAIHLNRHLTIRQNCKIDTQLKIHEQEKHHNYFSSDCSSNVDVRNGYSSELSKFIQKCQDEILRFPSNEQASSSQKSYFHPLPKTTKHKTSPTTTTTKPSTISSTTTTTVSSPTTSKFLHLIDHINICKHFDLSELAKKLRHRNEFIDYLNSVPIICQELARSLSLSNSNHYDSSLSYSTENNNSNNNNNNNSSKFKKCFHLRNSPAYEKCMSLHYKCFKYSNEPEKLRKCRKKFNITVPPKKKKEYFFMF
jgi:hypothetical protein